MEKYLANRIKSLIALRTSLIAVVIVTVSGTLGVLFTNIIPVVKWILFIVGAHFGILFLKNAINTDKEIEDLAERFLK
ncbi:MAG: hypothetical protein LBK53_09560 [Heliobacteriaceae bacterium]|jgi:hypothetical protein|nr:hypothetical protein [Heliobacteriaceae bacterium]